MELRWAHRLEVYVPDALQPNRVPRRFHLHGIENPIRIFRALREVVWDFASNVAFDVDGRAGLQFRADLFIPTGINDCIDVHVTGEMRRELGAISGEKIENAAGKVTRGDDFRKGEGSKRVCPMQGRRRSYRWQ